MAKMAFWITAGPELEEKALAGMVLASRLKKNRGQDVEVYFFGPGVKLVGSSSERVKEALSMLKDAQVVGSYCPFNAQQYSVEDAVSGAGLQPEPAGEALVRLVEQGYQVVGY
ncbi:MAG: DsrE family protein [Firmicutes bacterium]|nr:DsrE family protein [Bacillota bacterium]